MKMRVNMKTKIRLIFSKACLNCPYIELDNNITRYDKASNRSFSIGEIYCTHSPVCMDFDKYKTIDEAIKEENFDIFLKD